MNVAQILSAARVYTMLGNQPLWETAQLCEQILNAEKIAHALLGGVAVCLHGYQRNTIDLDYLVRVADTTRIKDVLLKHQFIWNEEAHQFQSPTGIPIHFLISGEKAGSRSSVVFPDPGDEDVTVKLECLSVLTLEKLIESKIVSGESNLRRTHKDFADVVELIIVHQLNSSYARKLHPSIRKTFRELAHQANS